MVRVGIRNFPARLLYFKMVNWETVEEVINAIVDWHVFIIKVLYIILEASFRLLCPKEQTSLTSDIVLITGSAHGIGRELALQYGLLGAKVVCVDINRELNEETVAELRKQGVSATAFHCDVTSREDVFNLRDKVCREVGPVSILINNAGLGPCKRFLNHTAADIKGVFNVNIIAHFWMLQAFLPAMVERNAGHVVALSSIAGLQGYANVVAYNATKYAIRGLMEGLAEEFRHDGRAIKFTTICPFMVDTGLCKKPKIRFGYFLGMISTKHAAEAIVRAQRRGMKEVSLPRYIRPSIFVFNLLPDAALIALRQFTDTGLEASDT